MNWTKARPLRPAGRRSADGAHRLRAGAAGVRRVLGAGILQRLSAGAARTAMSSATGRWSCAMAQSWRASTASSGTGSRGSGCTYSSAGSTPRRTTRRFPGSRKSIYVMKRLPSAKELHVRCLTIPAGACAVGFLVSLILLAIFAAVYHHGVPARCMPPAETFTDLGGVFLMLEIKDLCKRYADKQALDHVSLTVGPGEIVGLFGERTARARRRS